MPKLEKLHARYEDQGLVLIGIHTTNGGEKMAEFVKEQKISYPVAIDVKQKTKSAFRVDSFPDYYVIGRAGKLRVADLANGDLEKAIKMMLAEKAPEKPAEKSPPADG